MTDTADQIARLAVRDTHPSLGIEDTIAAHIRPVIEALEDIGNKKWGHRRGPQHIARAAIAHALRETGAEPHRCPKCGVVGGGHFIPPSMGEDGFYTCARTITHPEPQAEPSEPFTGGIK